MLPPLLFWSLPWTWEVWLGRQETQLYRGREPPRTWIPDPRLDHSAWPPHPGCAPHQEHCDHPGHRGEDTWDSGNLVVKPTLGATGASNCGRLGWMRTWCSSSIERQWLTDLLAGNHPHHMSLCRCGWMMGDGRKWKTGWTIGFDMDPFHLIQTLRRQARKYINNGSITNVARRSGCGTLSIVSNIDLLLITYSVSCSVLLSTHSIILFYDWVNIWEDANKHMNWLIHNLTPNFLTLEKSPHGPIWRGPFFLTPHFVWTATRN